MDTSPDGRRPAAWILSLLMAAALIVQEHSAQAQGIGRANGLGGRVSFWNINNHTTRFQVATGEEGQIVDVGGVGAWLYFSSRLHNNWFMESTFGAVATVYNRTGAASGTDVDVTAVLPFLFGLRCDLFPRRVSSAFQPYLAGGAGPYWITSVNIQGVATDNNVAGESIMKTGGCLGGGMNVVLRNWLALNFDLRYHFLEFNRNADYSGIQFALGTTLMWGQRQEMFRIEGTKLIIKDLYPAYFPFYATYPLALVTVRNTAGFPIEVNARARLSGISARPTDSGFMRLKNGETRDIPVTVIFGTRGTAASRRRSAVLDVEVEARAGRTSTRQTSMELVLHNRNAWSGEMDKLGFFVTPEDEEIRQLSRHVAMKSAEVNGDDQTSFHIARALFEELSLRNIRYHPDPNIPFYQDDRVQYAEETLDIGSGDCDDLVVLYASLLESMGINTAFVEVRDPEKEIAHLYIMFDSGVSPDRGDLVSTNEKRFVLRDTPSAQRRIWIPVETTLIDRGFDEAWQAAALQYLREGVLREGIAQGWVKIVDVH